MAWGGDSLNGIGTLAEIVRVSSAYITIGLGGVGGIV